MKRKIGIAAVFFILMFISFYPVKGQDIDIGVFGGGSYYLGELNPGKQFLFTRPAIGGLVRFNFNDRWAMRGQLIRGEVAGDDAVSKVNEMRNLRFSSNISELSALVEFNFLEYFSGSHVYYFSPFLFTGPAFFSFSPKTEYQGETIDLRDIGTEGQGEEDQYSLFSFAMAFGFGFKYSLTNRLGMTAEWGMRKTFTDYLDDISGNYYVDFNQLSPDEIRTRQVLSDPSPIKHQPGMQRGNPQNNDWYSFAGITLIYRFTIGEKSTCVDFDR
ncbi:MAG: hypothetical protein IH598_05145 [Bacteroidales bacterium]|nr:hypothetical protein [Bacteroidales bacterium]